MLASAIVLLDDADNRLFARLDEVPVLVKEVPDEAAAVMALIENIQREDLNPLEEAQGLNRLVREFGLTHEQAAQAVGHIGHGVPFAQVGCDGESTPIACDRH